MSWLRSWIERVTQTPEPAPPNQENPAPAPIASPAENQVVSGSPSAWVMPKYQGRDICDHLDEIARLKREKRFEEALTLAQGCMQAMVDAACENPNNAMEHYVIQVVVIQHKMKRYADEVHTLESWFATGIPAPREDHRTDLKKRLAKANELLAKQEGRDASGYTAQWRDLIDQQKALKTMDADPLGQSRPSSGRAATRSQTNSPHRNTLLPSAAELASPTFVAVDFETANRQGGVSACQVALVKFTNGRAVDKLTTYLKPPQGWDTFEFTYLHGISQRQTQRAPSWQQAVPGISRFVGDAPVYAHNAVFDAKVWRELDSFFGTRTLPEHFYCTYRLAKRVIPGLVNYKLPTVVEQCAPGFRLDHHQADSDAEACGLIVASLQENSTAPQLLD